MKVETKSLVLFTKNQLPGKETRTRGWLVRMRDLEEVNANRSIEGKG